MKPPTRSEHAQRRRLVRVLVRKSKNTVVHPATVATRQPIYNVMPLQYVVLSRAGSKKTNGIFYNVSVLFLQSLYACFRRRHILQTRQMGATELGLHGELTGRTNPVMCFKGKNKLPTLGLANNPLFSFFLRSNLIFLNLGNNQSIFFS